VNKTAASAQIASCILFHAYSCTTTAAPSCSSTNKKFSQPI